jgi:hypothetical protein
MLTLDFDTDFGRAITAHAHSGPGNKTRARRTDD